MNLASVGHGDLTEVLSYLVGGKIWVEDALSVTAIDDRFDIEIDQEAFTVVGQWAGKDADVKMRLTFDKECGIYRVDGVGRPDLWVKTGVPGCPKRTDYVYSYDYPELYLTPRGYSGSANAGYLDEVSDYEDD